jgi:DNA-directed RNA polymerase specialized sigma54-like protein
VASVAIDAPDHLPRLTYADDAGYDARYRVDTARLDSLPRDQRPRARALLQQLALVNQRRSLVCRIVRFVCDKQLRYLQTGDEADLLPLTQADIARGLAEAESTISRALRRKIVETPHGRRDLASFCRRKADIVAHLHAEHPEWTDARMAEEIASRYHCRLTRRTVAYHRARVRRRGKQTR